MPAQTISAVVKTGKILVSDGAWGTLLHQMGLQPGECPESWCIERFEAVKEIASQYIAAGADMVKTNSFGGSAYKLEYYGLDAQVMEINESAAKASRMAAGKDVWVLGSMGPTGKMLITEEVTEQELYTAFKEQAIALAKGGADAICIETMSDIEEACLAVKAAKENTQAEVICTFTFDKTVQGDYRTMMGVTPGDAALAAVEAGADIIGTNCGSGMERMVEIIKQMRAACAEKPILVHANAGMPQNVEGEIVFPETPEDMALQVPALIQAGANIIGGCCGTTPKHIKAIKQAVLAYF